MSKVSIGGAALLRNLKRFNGERKKPHPESKEVGVPHLLSKKHTPRWLLLTAVLAALAFLAVGTEPEPIWVCSPIDPLANALPAKPCFRAMQTSENLVTLEWRVVNSQPLVYIYDDFGPQYNDVRFRPASCNSRVGNSCATSFRVAEGGHYRWQLMVESQSKESRIHAPVSIHIKGPLAPLAVLGGGMVDQLGFASRTFSWEVDPANRWPADDTEQAWVELQGPGDFLWGPTRYPRSGAQARYTVAASEFKVPGGLTYGIRDCHFPTGSSRSFCSPPKKVGFYVGSDHFDGNKLINISSGADDLEVTFTSRSGDLWLLTSPTLVPAFDGLHLVATTDSSYIIDSALLTPGEHMIELVSCNTATKACSNRQDADRAAKDGVLEQMPPGYYLRGDLIATIRPEDGSDSQSIYAQTNGKVYFGNLENGQHVKAGDFIAAIITAASDRLHILVDSPVEWILERDYTLDFESIDTHSIFGNGHGLDVVYDDSGGIWLSNEFSNNIEHVKPGGDVESLTVPLQRNPLWMPRAFSVVQPFALQLGANRVTPTSISSLAERVTQIDGKTWFTQGGGLLFNTAGVVKNHSRIGSFDPTLIDTPATFYDDRLCVYNVPTDDINGVGNNQVIGLTATRDRIWIAEIRGFFSDQPSSISSFIPNPADCGNLLNFDDPAALANQNLQYCSFGRTPEQDGCMQRYLLDTLPAGIKVAHLAADESNGTIWFTDAHGKYLGSLDPNRENPFRIYQIPDTHDETFSGIPGFGGFPWSLRVDHKAVYFAEYSTQHILRFDKASATFDEIHVPYTTNQVTLHSIDIDPVTDRLWFTLSNEVAVQMSVDASKVGYIDLASWREHVADPDGTRSISAVIYRGMDSMEGLENKATPHHAFRGIAVDPASGKIALASMWRSEIVELTPYPGFWP